MPPPPPPPHVAEAGSQVASRSMGSARATATLRQRARVMGALLELRAFRRAGQVGQDNRAAGFWPSAAEKGKSFLWKHPSGRAILGARQTRRSHAIDDERARVLGRGGAGPLPRGSGMWRSRAFRRAGLRA